MNLQNADIYDLYRMSDQYRREEELAMIHLEKLEDESRRYDRYLKMKRIKKIRKGVIIYRVVENQDDIPF